VQPRFAQAGQADEPGDRSRGPGVIDPDVQDVGLVHSVREHQPDRDDAQWDGRADGRGQLREDATRQAPSRHADRGQGQQWPERERGRVPAVDDERCHQHPGHEQDGEEQDQPGAEAMRTLAV
jgi:hypothetical protein